MNSISVLHIELFQAGKNTSDFYFNTMKNHLVVGHRHIEKPHRHDFYAAVLFTGGRGVHEIDFQKYDVSEGSLFFLSPGQIHSWELSEDIEGYIFFCSQEFYEMHYVNQKLRNFPFFGSVSFPRKLQLNASELKKNISLFRELGKEHQAKNHIIKDSDTMASSAALSYFKHYQEFENLIELHFTEQKSIAYYASLLGISSKHLNRIVQTVVQKTATEVITERVVLEAKRMLMYLDESLVEIAFRLGYEEYSYFVRVFRKSSGMTPTQFMRKYKA